ncbi:UNVERIFIED_CONTAM: hypothetical protein FKN15_032099 [Acipenser sinensis]
MERSNAGPSGEAVSGTGSSGDGEQVTQGDGVRGAPGQESGSVSATSPSSGDGVCEGRSVSSPSGCESGRGSSPSGCKSDRGSSPSVCESGRGSSPSGCEGGRGSSPSLSSTTGGC